MKRKIFSVLFAVVLVLSFSLVTAVPAVADPAILEVRGPVQLATGALNLGSFSPDGSKIVYGGAGAIWVMNADGSDPQQIYASGTRPKWGPPIVGHPDGLIALAGTGITIIQPDGTLVKTIVTDHVYPGDGLIKTGTHSLDWSPDGKELAFADNAGTMGIWVIGFDGTGLTQITDYSLTAYSPAWSPDGTEIACAWGPSTNMFVGVFKADGSGWDRSIGIGGSYGGDYPDWGANGKVAYHDGAKALHVMNGDGTGDTVVFAGPAAMVAWSPDGQTLAYVDATSGLFGNVWTRGYPYATIQAAINAASDFDIINVAAGTYVENVTIDKTLTLQSTELHEAKINGSVTIGGAHVDASNAVLEGFDIQGGVHIWDHDNVTVTYNKITTSDSNGICYSHGSSSGGTVTHNVVSAPGKMGICLDHDGGTFTVAYNTVEARKAIMFGTLSGGVIEYNTISSPSSDCDIEVWDASIVTAHYNNLVGEVWNSDNPEKPHTCGDTLDATNNWWGTLSGSAIKGMLSGNVNYDPWDNEAHTQSYTTPSEVWVDDDWAAIHPDDPVDGHIFGYDAFATIQGGVDAVAESGTVNVASGEYDAFAVEGRSDLSIIGEEGATVVDAIEFDGDVVMALIIESTDIDISDIDFDGTESSPDTGIFYLESTGSIADLTVSNITGEEYSFGIGLVASDVDLSGVNVDSSMGGIFILNAEANLDECTITGMSSEGGIGIMAIGGAMVSIENSEISDFWVEVPEPGTAGLGMMIGMEGSLSTVGMTGCTISGNNFGIYIDDDGELVANFNNIVENNVFGVWSEALAAVDATENWWGTTDESLIDEMVEGDVDYTPWLPASFDQVEPGAVDSADVSGSETGEVDLKDDDKNTIATVDISDAPSDAEGTIIASRYSEEPAPGGISLSAGTGKTGVVFLDIQVTGYASGTATITVPYPDDVEPFGFVDNTDPLIDETTLGFYYWSEDASMWLLAANNEVDTVNNTVSGDIPVGALIGTPNGLSGYPANEATVEIRNITDLSFSGNDTVDLTITTTTAQLGAATIEVTFDNTVVEVLGGENSQFDSLTVNPFSGTQTARFVASQLGAAGVDATEVAVLAQVRLKAVGTTGSSSLLELTVITLKDNDGVSIPVGAVINGTATIGGLGDANLDGVVDVYDCVFIAWSIAGIPGYSVTTVVGDVSGDKVVDAWDCTYLARRLAGIAGYD